MSETKKIVLNSLYAIVLRESENELVQEIDPNLYTNIAEFIGELKRQEYDNVEAKIKDELVKITSKLLSLLLNMRLEKTINSKDMDHSNLLDEEKFILDAEEELRERKEIILSAALNGKSKLLEAVSKNHKTKSVVVRFLQEMDQMVGSDFEKYGPFKVEDVATIPYDNAHALITQKIVTKVRWKD